MDKNDIYQALPQREKLSDQVVDQLVQLIQNGQLELGELLPPERELAENFGVSRTVIREAIRSLVAKGLLEVRPGSGAVVSVPDSKMVAESMSMIMRLKGGDMLYTQIFEVRKLLEVEFAGLAAERAYPDNILNLENLLEIMMEDCPLDDAAECDVDFHSEIARATQNELFPIILDSVVDVMLELRRLSLSMTGTKEQAIKYHRDLVTAIKEKDPEKARAIMAEHLNSGEKIMRSFLDDQP